MKCFYHPQTDAVGVCKSCFKGLCKECAVDVGNGIACKDVCESEVKAINEVAKRSRSMHQKTSGACYRQAIFVAIAGIAELLCSFIMSYDDYGYFKYVTMGAGIISLIGAALFYVSGMKFKNH